MDSIYLNNGNIIPFSAGNLPTIVEHFDHLNEDFSRLFFRVGHSLYYRDIEKHDFNDETFLKNFCTNIFNNRSIEHNKATKNQIYLVGIEAGKLHLDCPSANEFVFGLDAA